MQSLQWHAVMRQSKHIIAIVFLTGFVFILTYMLNVTEKERDKFKFELDKLTEHSLQNDSLLGEYQISLSTFLDSDSACAQKFIKIIENVNTGE